MIISEDIFDWSSHFTANQLILRPKNEIFCHLIQFVDTFFDNCGLTDQDKLKIYRETIGYFGIEFKKALKQISTMVKNEFRIIRFSLNELKSNQMSEQNTLSDLCNKLENKLDRETLKSLLKSHVHMHVNRAFVRNQRLEEFKLYQYLEKYTVSRIATVN